MPNTKVVAEYKNLAQQYDSRFEHYNVRTLSEAIFSLENIDHKSILDVGCGTGILLSLIARLNGTTQLFGVDLTPEMLHRAQTRLDYKANLITADSEHLPFSPNSFDIALSTNCFHYFSNQEAALLEIRRILKPGGEILITDWCHDYFLCKICDAYLRLTGKGHYHMLGSSACHSLLEKCDYLDLSIKMFKINWLWGMMTIRGRKP